MEVRQSRILTLPTETLDQIVGYLISDLRPDTEHCPFDALARKKAQRVVDFGLSCKSIYSHKSVQRALADQKLSIKSYGRYADQDYVGKQLTAQEKGLSEIQIFNDSKPEPVAPCRDPDTLISLTSYIKTEIESTPQLRQPDEIKKFFEAAKQRCRVLFKMIHCCELMDQERVLISLGSLKIKLEKFVVTYRNLPKYIQLGYKNGDRFEPLANDFSKCVFSNIEKINAKGMNTSCENIFKVYQMFSNKSDEEKMIFWKDAFNKSKGYKYSNRNAALIYLVAVHKLPRRNRLGAFKKVFDDVKSLPHAYQSIWEKNFAIKSKNFREMIGNRPLTLLG